MNDNRTFKFFTWFLIVVILCYLAFAGLGPVNARIIKGANDLRTGIDIRGGISAVMVPDYDKVGGSQGRDIAGDLATSAAIIEDRLDAQGIFDKSINIDATNGRIIIDIPWAQNEAEFNPRKALDELGETGRLTFREVLPEDEGKSNDQISAAGKEYLSGEDVANASYSSAGNGYYNVDLEFKSSGVEKFSNATKELTGRYMGIFIDDQCISAPYVSKQISQSKAIIEGTFTMQEAKSLGDKIRFGALPVPLKADTVDSISAQLGQGAAEVAVTAGFVAFIAVCLLMILYYRWPGVIATLALATLAALTILFMSNLGFSITLPGIGGIILSIGMGVDANVIIYERIKEELKAGKTLRAAIDTGFKRAFVSIVDSNITTLIVAVVLTIMGTGAVKGFGITLGLGVLISFFTCITVTKSLLASSTVFGFTRNKWMFGVREVKDGGVKA